MLEPPLLRRYVCHTKFGVKKPPVVFTNNQRSPVPPHLPVFCSYLTEDESCVGCEKKVSGDA